MFASNVTPAIIIAGAAGIAFTAPERVYLIQMAVLFAGVATLIQAIGIGPVGARLPIVQGTSFAFLPITTPVISPPSPSTPAPTTAGIMIGKKAKLVP